ncbi:MAG: DUF1858 domain-containing protein [Bacillota bacterium]
MVHKDIINKDMIIFDILQQFPEAEKVLESFGMRCSECLAVVNENLAQSAVRHNVELESLLTALNKLRK